MVKPCLSRAVKLVIRHSRGFHSQPWLGPQGPIPVARLLEAPPRDPDHVIVNGFIRSIRNQKHRSFASIGDGSSLEPLQALLTPQQAQRYD
jgi:asparaginyl-tRNA synthetase